MQTFYLNGPKNDNVFLTILIYGKYFLHTYVEDILRAKFSILFKQS